MSTECRANELRISSSGSRCHSDTYLDDAGPGCANMHKAAHGNHSVPLARAESSACRGRCEKAIESSPSTGQANELC